MHLGCLNSHLTHPIADVLCKSSHNGVDVHKNHNSSNGDNYINIKKLNDANNSIKYTHNRTRTNYTGLYILVAMTAIAGDGK